MEILDGWVVLSLAKEVQQVDLLLADPARNQLNKMKELKSELAQYKKMYADIAFQNTVLKDVMEKALRL